MKSHFCTLSRPHLTLPIAFMLQAAVDIRFQAARQAAWSMVLLAGPRVLVMGHSMEPAMTMSSFTVMARKSKIDLPPH